MIGEAALKAAFLYCGIFTTVPLLVVSLVGLIVGVLQTAIQVQEQTTLFISKLLITALVLYFGAPVALRALIILVHKIFLNLP